MFLFIPEGVYADPLRIMISNDNNVNGIHNGDLGIGTVKTEGMICTCQGSSCSCIGKNDAHCLWEDDGMCINSVDLNKNGEFGCLL